MVEAEKHPDIERKSFVSNWSLSTGGLADRCITAEGLRATENFCSVIFLSWTQSTDLIIHSKQNSDLFYNTESLAIMIPEYKTKNS